MNFRTHEKCRRFLLHKFHCGKSQLRKSCVIVSPQYALQTHCFTSTEAASVARLQAAKLQHSLHVHYGPRLSLIAGSVSSKPFPGH